MDKKTSKKSLLKQNWMYIQDESNDVEQVFQYPLQNDPFIDLKELKLHYYNKKIEVVELMVGDESIANNFQKELILKKFKPLRNENVDGFYVETYISEDQKYVLGIAKTTDEKNKISNHMDNKFVNKRSNFKRINIFPNANNPSPPPRISTRRRHSFI